MNMRHTYYILHKLSVQYNYTRSTWTVTEQNISKTMFIKNLSLILKSTINLITGWNIHVLGVSLWCYIVKHSVFSTNNQRLWGLTIYCKICTVKLLIQQMPLNGDSNVLINQLSPLSDTLNHINDTLCEDGAWTACHLWKIIFFLKILGNQHYLY